MNKDSEITEFVRLHFVLERLKPDDEGYSNVKKRYDQLSKKVRRKVMNFDLLMQIFAGTREQLTKGLRDNWK